MADTKENQIHLPLISKDGKGLNGDKVTFISSQVKSPPLNDQLNNVQLLGIPPTQCNGIPSMSELKTSSNSCDDNHKRTMAALTHLPKRPPVDIEFNNVSFSVSEGRRRGFKTILKGVNGQFRSGELTAIMGPSGAGKSTLMNILAGYKVSNLSGTVLINGKSRNLRQFRKLSCYIMQDDCLSPHLTVREAMFVSANLKLGKDINLSDKRIVIDEILELLLLKEAENTRTMNLSGGQRKRLSIALELVNNPPVMFFDEPTSGLDSSSCFQCIALLKNLARGGRTIICTIHQPSARLFELFDNLYTLADGQCIYEGTVPGLVPFLSSMGLHCPSYHNPADYVIEVATGEHGLDWVEKLVVAVKNGKCSNHMAKSPANHNFNTSQPYSVKNQLNGFISRLQNNKSKNTNNNDADSKLKKPDTVIDIPTSTSKETYEKPNALALTSATCTTSLLDSNESVTNKSVKAGFPTSSWKQYWILLCRTFKSILRDQTLTHLRLLSHALIGLLIGALFYNIGSDADKFRSNIGCIFFTVMFTMFTAMMPTILTFPTEMSVFVREHLNYWYSIKSFYLAKTTADLPFQIAFSGIYVIIVYYMTGQPMETDRVLMFTSINIMTALVAQSLGLLIGAGMKIETGVYLGPVTTIPVVLFSGFFIDFESVPPYLRWLTYVSYVRYGFEGSLLAVYGFNRPKMKCSATFCLFRKPEELLKTWSMENANFWVDFGALTFMFISIRIIAYIILRFKLRMMR